MRRSMATIENQHRPVNWLVLLVVALVVVVAVGMVLAMAFADNSPSTDGDFGMMGSWGGAWGLMMIVPIAVVVLIIIVLVIALTDRPGVPTYPAVYSPPYASAPPWSGDARSVLDRRLAAGEVTVEEYNRIKDELSRR
jgi:uncharacterized membrane protein